MLLTLPVREIIDATPRARIVRLALGPQKFSYRAGQSVFVGMHDQNERRPYSIASAPEQTTRQHRLELLIQVGNGAPSGSHLQGLQPDSLVDIEGPHGSFVFPDRPSERHFLFIAGGRGIAPLRAMIWHLLLARRGSRWPEGQHRRIEVGPLHIGLLYSARTPDDFAYADELEQLARQDQIRLQRTVTRGASADWSGHLGRISHELLSGLLVDTETLCFICGPRTLVEAMPGLLRSLGISAERIRIDEWG